MTKLDFLTFRTQTPLCRSQTKRLSVRFMHASGWSGFRTDAVTSTCKIGRTLVYVSITRPQWQQALLSKHSCTLILVSQPSKNIWQQGAVEFTDVSNLHWVDKADLLSGQLTLPKPDRVGQACTSRTCCQSSYGKHLIDLHKMRKGARKHVGSRKRTAIGAPARHQRAQEKLTTTIQQASTCINTNRSET